MKEDLAWDLILGSTSNQLIFWQRGVVVLVDYESVEAQCGLLVVGLCWWRFVKMDFELLVVGLRWWRFVKMGFELVVVGLRGEKGTTMGGRLWVSWFWFDSTRQSYKRVDSISTQAGKFSR